MRRTTPLIGILLILCQWHGQTQNVAFEYDGAGNRILRTIIVGNQALKSASSIFDEVNGVKKENVAGDSIQSASAVGIITIYPNPTCGQMVIKTENLPEKVKPIIILTAISGKNVMEQEITGIYTNIDFSGEADGIYILTIITGNQKQQWQVVKKGN